jgi:hypothetical protein
MPGNYSVTVGQSPSSVTSQSGEVSASPLTTPTVKEEPLECVFILTFFNATRE